MSNRRNRADFVRACRRLVLVAPLLLLGCANDTVTPRYEPLHYKFLTPLQLNVASIEFAPLPPPGPLDGASPIPAAPALRDLAADRLSAAGSSGRAMVTIEEARITGSGSALDGTMALRIDILTSDGGKAGFAEARVSRARRGGDGNLASSLYEMTKQMLDDMNVELEYQLRLSLRDYVQTVSTAPLAPIGQQELKAPATGR